MEKSLVSAAEIRRAAALGRTMRLVFPLLSPVVGQKLQLVLQELLARYGRENLIDCLYSCIFELVTNASRANMKHIFFLDHPVEEDDAEEYAEALRRFRAHRQKEGRLEYYRRRVKEENLQIEIVLAHSPDGLRIEVVNNLPLRPRDERRIREKFSRAMQADDVYEFFTRYADDSEGQGLGFAMNVIFLRAEKIDPSLFRIVPGPDRTVARLEIPFSDRFQSLRGPGVARHN